MTSIAEIKSRMRLPVIGAPLFIISNPKLVSAQCTAGIIGSFPALNARPQEALGEWITQIKDDINRHNDANPDQPAAPDKAWDYRISRAGRFVSFPDGRWVQDANAASGMSLVAMNESTGTDADPIAEWENIGIWMRPGETLSETALIGRVNDQLNTLDMELMLAFVAPDAPARLEGGWDSDSEVSITPLWRNFWRSTTTPDALGQVPFTHPINDLHRRLLPVNFTATEEGWITMFARPLRNPGSAGNDNFFLQMSHYFKAPEV